MLHQILYPYFPYPLTVPPRTVIAMVLVFGSAHYHQNSSRFCKLGFRVSFLVEFVSERMVVVQELSQVSSMIRRALVHGVRALTDPGRADGRGTEVLWDLDDGSLARLAQWMSVAGTEVSGVLATEALLTVSVPGLW